MLRETIGEVIQQENRRGILLLVDNEGIMFTIRCLIEIQE